MNNKAQLEYEQRRRETGKDYGETDRRCSYCGSAGGGLVLHSAKQRSTVFIAPGAAARKFLAEWHGTNSDVKHDSLVESYFSNPATRRHAP